MSRRVTISFATLLLLAQGWQTWATETVPAEVLFVRKVLPIFQSKCLACHGENPEKKLKGRPPRRGRMGGGAYSPK